MEYTGFTTNYDLMKEGLIQGAQITDYWNFPQIKPFHGKVSKTISFGNSSSKKFTDYKNTNLNFFEDDYHFNCIWNQPYRYLEHFAKFQNVCMPDFSRSEEAPLPISLWNNYRNMALAHWMSENGIDVIPCISTLPKSCWDWCFDGFPMHSVYCCQTNGFLRDKRKKEYFIQAFHEAEKRLEPECVYVVGRKIADLEANCDIIYLENRSIYNEKMTKEAQMQTPNRIKMVVKL